LSGKIGLGVVGCGNVAGHSYLRHAKELADLVATCDRIEERARRAYLAYGARTYYNRFEDMLEDKRIEAVLILTPANSHGELAMEAARAGKHFLVQKMLAMNMEQANGIVHEAGRRGIKALAEPAVQLNYFSRKMKELLRGDVIGKAAYAVCRAEQEGPIESPAAFEEGPVISLGIYGVAHMTDLLGPVRAVSAIGTMCMPDRLVVSDSVATEAFTDKGYDPSKFDSTKATKKAQLAYADNYIVSIEFVQGGLGCIIANYVTDTRWGQLNIAYDFPFFELYGLEGALILRWNSLMGYSAKKRGASGELGWFIVDPPSRSQLGNRLLGNFYWDYYRDSLKHFLECIERDKEPVATLEWGRHLTEVMLKACESAQTGKVLEIRSRF